VNTWFTSDTHFGHANIIRLCNRPYSSVEEMDEALIENWNSLVRDGDIVYHLGDFAFRGNNEKTTQIFNRLKGDKVLIRGNHDDYHTTENLDWQSVHMYFEKKGFKGLDRLVMFHYPMREWNGWYRGAVHLYGHCHDTLPLKNNSCDVGVDSWNYHPVNYEQIIALIEKNPTTERPF
jgi:calcineurin-like phosphoesterase family protein